MVVLFGSLPQVCYSYLPLGNRVIRKISQIVREEMDRAGGQEISMPVIQPKDLWDKQPASGPSRTEAMGDVLFKLKDRKGREMVLGPDHEEVVTTLVSEFVRSYRDLPQLIYQIQTKLRDEPRPRAGLLRVGVDHEKISTVSMQMQKAWISVIVKWQMPIELSSHGVACVLLSFMLKTAGQLAVRLRKSSSPSQRLVKMMR